MRSILRQPARRLPRWGGVAIAAGVIALFASSRAQAVSFCEPGPGDRPETSLQGSVTLAEQTAPGGFQGHWCGAATGGALGGGNFQVVQE